MNFHIRQSVKVTNEKHPRLNDAGVVEAVDPKGKKLAVRFDTPEPAGELVDLKFTDVTLLQAK